MIYVRVLYQQRESHSMGWTYGWVLAAPDLEAAEAAVAALDDPKYVFRAALVLRGDIDHPENKHPAARAWRGERVAV